MNKKSIYTIFLPAFPPKFCYHSNRHPSSVIPCEVVSADLKSLWSTILIGEPNRCIINVRNPKLINIHKRVIFKVIAFIPFQNASDKTPQPAISTIHVLSNTILFTRTCRVVEGRLGRVSILCVIQPHSQGPLYTFSRWRKDPGNEAVCYRIHNKLQLCPLYEGLHVCLEIHFYNTLDM